MTGATFLNRDMTKFITEHFKTRDGEQYIPSPGQEEIIRIITFKTPTRTACNAFTRYGKSEAVALGAICRNVMFPGELTRIIAPQGAQTRIIMGYIRQHIVDHEMFYMKLAGIDRRMTKERLDKQLTGSRMVFTNNSEIMVMAANIREKGQRIYGAGATLLIIDEIESIPVFIVKNSIMRMLGDDPERAAVFMISNPTAPGYMYEKIKGGNYHVIHIGWRQGIEEGRTNRAFIEERRDDLKDMPELFEIWYESRYPEAMETRLIQPHEVRRAIGYREFYEYLRSKLVPREIVLGVDVATRGRDLAVLTTVEKFDVTAEEAKFHPSEEGMMFHGVRDIRSYKRCTTPQLIDLIKQAHTEFSHTQINVDYTGNGEGVVDGLIQEEGIGSKVSGVINAEGCDSKDDRKHFVNKKAHMHWNLRKLFQRGMIYVPSHQRLFDNLVSFGWKMKNDSRIMVLDPPTLREQGENVKCKMPSPDFADSLAFACFEATPIERIVVSRSRLW